jgi:hypothetical protein
MATEKKKSAPKKLTVKDLEGLKAGKLMASGGTEVSAIGEASDGVKHAVNKKTNDSFSQA